MAVTLFHKYHIIINNKVTIKNNKKEETHIVNSPVVEKPKNTTPKEIDARIRGKMYGRRTINR